MSISKISLRYPPFDRDSANPNMIKPVECFLNTEMVNPIKIGSESSWYAHWTPSDGDTGKNTEEIQVSYNPDDLIISKRRGWFIKPDPLHKISRQFLPYGVFAIFAALSAQAFFGSFLEDLPLIGGDSQQTGLIGPLRLPSDTVHSIPDFHNPDIPEGCLKSERSKKAEDMAF